MLLLLLLLLLLCRRGIWMHVEKDTKRMR